MKISRIISAIVFGSMLFGARAQAASYEYRILFLSSIAQFEVALP
jgi:hypothetical protein